MRFSITMTLFAWLLAGAAGVSATEASNTPESVVKSYYAALQARKYENAYDLLTSTMIDGRTRKEYVADWQNIINLGSVILHEYGISSVDIDGDTAKVSAWTRASDVFNKDGIIEKEVDHLKLIDGVWKLDATEVLLE
ncbi:MAG: hypothetical protein EP334_03050 [Gammaproteobacteria bacterium]|nr:MAG: hypothetical protein EP334_03050 [Gammaproteobacteria bacterium]